MPPMNSTIPIAKEANEVPPQEVPTVPAKPKDAVPPKVDRPRPHVCSICSRSFARLEHLKRHERSHTKEKPFECPECLRCFARRDLLLRHQQKLHLTTTPSSRPRNGVRRESTSSVAQPAGSRVRKNSVSNAGGRPRANTIAHVDSNTLSMLAKSTTANGQPLPKLETGSLRGLNVVGTSLGVSTVVPQDLEIEGILFGNTTTVNPAMLQFNASPHHHTFGSPTSPFEAVFGNSNAVVDDEDDSEWMTMFGSSHYASEQAVESSSPSAISTTSISGVSEALQDTNTWWNNNASTLSSATTLSTSPFMSSSDYAAPPFNPSPPPAGTISPKALQAQGGHHESFFGNYNLSTLSPTHFLSPESHFQPELQPDFPHDFSVFQPTSAAAHATQSITDSARAAILLTLAQSSNAYRAHQTSQHQRRYSSAQSPPMHAHRPSFTAQLPGTQDLQRYVQGYIKHFHPHMPFFHIATLDFSSPAYAANQKTDNLLGLSGFAGGGGCLVLSMSAIGALYEGDYSAAKEIYEAAKKMIHIFIDNRRKASVTAALSGNGKDASTSTPLWLVQSMLLNVVFGLNSGEHMSSDLAMSHCTAVVSLARTAGLCKPATNVHSSHLGPDASMLDMWNGAMKLESLDDHADWTKWVAEEERKRTLYAVHKLSSMLCITYNHPPALTNSEIRLDLPCDEELWAAETATMWKMRGGIQAAKQAAVPFSTALNALLSAGGPQESQRRSSMPHDDLKSMHHRHGKPKPSELRPSHFGALSLILALHVYIWETRQLSHARQWSSSDVEAVHAHIEPALRAWEEAWASHPQSSIERPSPFGIGPMAADSIPLLNLAYVRLFVDLGRSRGPLFARDFAGMVDELNKNWMEQPTASSSSNSSASESADTPRSTSSPASSPTSTLNSPDLNPIKANLGYPVTYPQVNGISSRHEKHIRRAAFYAADALAMSEKSGLSSPEFLARELPMQSLMCAFDCAQVLAEWVNAVQERVRPFMGKFGDAECDLMSIEALMMLETEDRMLLGRVIDILKKSHEKMVFEWDSIVGGNDEVSVSILRVSAHLLEKASVWPGRITPETRLKMALTMVSYSRESILRSPSIPCRQH
ncbi:hypothetical protein TWF696_003152 [Orbilia brochopaga]|uniref:C2H2-type domain-containing protein n=1 Tax=Orbilia brochopaga TaxID=3140254 RepID=A0AAV9TZP3_9PEZI